jgi:hypothetical protein
MNLIISIYAALLFFILTPAILVRLPPGGSKFTVAVVHAVVFAIVFYFTHNFVMRLGSRLEGMEHGPTTATPSMMPSASTKPKL